jgi:hypothetical protein
MRRSPGKKIIIKPINQLISLLGKSTTMKTYKNASFY